MSEIKRIDIVRSSGNGQTTITPNREPNRTWRNEHYPDLAFHIWVEDKKSPSVDVIATTGTEAVSPHYAGAAFLQETFSTPSQKLSFSLYVDDHDVIAGTLQFLINGDSSKLMLNNFRSPGGNIDKYALYESIPSTEDEPEDDEDEEFEEYILPSANQNLDPAKDNALPRQLPSGEAPAIVLPDGHDPVAAPYVFPYCYVGSLWMQFPDGETYLGTATVIDTQDPLTRGLYLLTCAHNLYDRESKTMATSVFFTLADNDSDDSFLPLPAEKLFVPSKYKTIADEDQFKYDYGLIRLKERIPLSLAPKMSSLPDTKLLSHKIQLTGLYGWDEAELTKMFEGKGEITLVNDDFLYYDVSTRQGASGTAVTLLPLDSPPVVTGVHVCGKKADEKPVTSKPYNQAVRLTDTRIAKINKWILRG